MTHTLAIDFGGTRIRAALFDAQMHMLKRVETLTRVPEGQTAVIQRLIDAGKSVVPDDVTLKAIGMAAPGPLDVASGVILRAETLPGWSHVPLGNIISEAFANTPTYLQNDANLGALAEYHLGAGRGANPLLYLTISTGIGGGAIIDGKLFTGQKGLAIEPGHMRFTLPDGSVRRLEELASGTALGMWANRALTTENTPSSLRNVAVVDGRAVGEAALAGDALALRVVTQAGRWLGLGLVNLLHLFNPQAIVVGGSVVKLGDLIFEPAREVIRANILFDEFFNESLLKKAEIEEDMCLYGAALHSADQTG